MLRLQLFFLATLAITLGTARGLLWVFFGPDFDPKLTGPLFFMGLRFDLKVGALMLLLIWIGLGPIYFWQRLRRVTRSLEKILLPILTTALLIAVLLALIEHQYVGYFQQTFSPLLFGLLEDDTVGIFYSIWTTLPVVPILILWFVLMMLTGIGFYRLGQMLLARQPLTARQTIRLMSALFFTCALLFLARGTSGEQPLNRESANLSTNDFLNSIVTNAPVNLWDAVSDRAYLTTLTRAGQQQFLQSYGFQTINEALHVIDPDPIKAQANLFTRTLSSPPPQIKPHVVMGLLESWAQYPIRLSDANNDLLGRFAAHMGQDARSPDLVFPHFYAANTPTYPSLEANLFNSPIVHLTAGQYGQIALPLNPFEIFRKQGYRTIFVYAGPRNWHRMGKVIPHQGFDNLYDLVDIQQAIPDTKTNYWGAHDEYLYRFMLQLLEKANQKDERLFIFFLTTTHHPPFSPPEGYAAHPIDVAKMKSAVNLPADEAVNHAVSIQYEFDQFGKFIDQIKASQFSDRVVIAASGDHTRNYFHLDLPAQTEALHAIASYFYIPSSYRSQRSMPDPQRTFASHHNILPSLIDLALGSAPHLAFGDSLFSPRPSEREFGLSEFRVLFATEGVVVNLQGTPRFYRWQNDALIADQQPLPSLLKKLQYARARTALAGWYLYEKLLTAQ